MSELTPTQLKIKGALELAAQNCGGKLRMQAAVDSTASWLYTCTNRGTVPLELAMKLEVLTKGEFKFQELCPDKMIEINTVAEYLK